MVRQEQLEQYEAAGVSREHAMAMAQSDYDEDIPDRRLRPRRNTSPADALQLPDSNEAARAQLSALDRYILR